MASADARTKEELQGLLANVAATHQKTAEVVDVPSSMCGER